MGVHRAVCRIRADSEPRPEAVRQARSEEVRASDGKFQISRVCEKGRSAKTVACWFRTYIFFYQQLLRVAHVPAVPRPSTSNRVSERAQGSQAKQASPVLPVSVLDVSPVCEKAGKREDEAAKKRGELQASCDGCAALLFVQVG